VVVVVAVIAASALALLGGCTTTGASPTPPGTTVVFVSLAAADRSATKAAADEVVKASVHRRETLIVRPVTATASAAKAITFGPDAGGGTFRSNARNRAARKVEQAGFVEAATRAVDDAIDAMPAADDVGVDLDEITSEGLTTARALGGAGSIRLVVISTGLQHTVDTSVLGADAVAHPSLTSSTDVPAPLSLLFVGIGAFVGVAENVDPTLVARVRAFVDELCAQLAPASCRVVPTFDTTVVAAAVDSTRS
jgi:hypothetical protein